MVKHRDQWHPLADEPIWGGKPVEPVSAAEIHDHEVGSGGSGSHPPGFAVAVYEQQVANGYTQGQQWYFVPGAGKAFPIGPGELDDLGVRNKALPVPLGTLDQFKYGDIHLPNGTIYRPAGGAQVRHQVDQPNGSRDSFVVGGDTTLSCLELVQGKQVTILPQSAIPYAEAGVRVLSANTACSYPPGMVVRGPGGQEQWRIEGDGSSTNYIRRKFSSAALTYLHTGGHPDVRELRSVAAINNTVSGPDMQLPNGQLFRDTGTGTIYVSWNTAAQGQKIEHVNSPDMVTCLPTPNKSVIDIPSNAMVALPVAGDAYCNYEGRIIYGPDGRQFLINQGRKQPIGIQPISACVQNRRGTGAPIGVSDSTLGDYTQDSRGAWCNYEGEPGLNFVREQGDPTVWLVGPGTGSTPGTKRHVGSLCVPDPETTPLKKFHVFTVPAGETGGHQQGADWFASGVGCGELPG